MCARTHRHTHTHTQAHTHTHTHTGTNTLQKKKKPTNVNVVFSWQQSFTSGQDMEALQCGGGRVGMRARERGTWGEGACNIRSLRVQRTSRTCTCIGERVVIVWEVREGLVEWTRAHDDVIRSCFTVPCVCVGKPQTLRNKTRTQLRVSTCTYVYLRRVHVTASALASHAHTEAKHLHTYVSLHGTHARTHAHTHTHTHRHARTHACPRACVHTPEILDDTHAHSHRIYTRIHTEGRAH
jgi:hypothetical protein